MLLTPGWSADLPEDLWRNRMEGQSRSVECWRRTAGHFSSYTEKYSFVNRSELPEETCADPSIIDRSKELYRQPPALTYGHYGVYTSHRNAILDEFGEDLDAIVLIEGDTMFKVDPEEMVSRIYAAYDFALANDGKMVTFADVRYGWASQAEVNDTSVDFGEYKKVDHFMPAYCYMVMASERQSLLDKIATAGWHSWDIWLYWNYDRRSTLFATKEQYVFECGGYSTADYTER